MPVSFATDQREATIRNLADAPSPPELVPGSPHVVFRSASSPRPRQQRSSSPRKRLPRPPPPPPPPPLYDDEIDDSTTTPSSENGELHGAPSSEDDLENDSSEKKEGIDVSDILDDEDDDSDGDDSHVDDADDDDDSERVPVTLCGFKIPYCTRKKTNWNRISSRVVRYAPCFWCMPRSESGITDRAILYRLNILCAFFAVGQIASAIFFMVVTVARGVADRTPISGREESDALAPNLWSLIGTIYFTGIVAVVILIATIVTLRVIKQVRFVGSLRYMWFLLWITPLEIFLVIGLFDYHNVSLVWVKHWWYVPVMAWFRRKYCASGTDRTTCVVPICGLPSFGLQSATYPYKGTDSDACIAGEAAWCKFFFNTTDCRDIRNEAQGETEELLNFFLNLNFAWGVMLVLLLILTIHVLEGIITKPIIQKSRESNIPGWLTFPIVWSVVAGAVLLFSPSSVLNLEERSKYEWVGVLFMVVGGLFFMAALWGWFVSSFAIMNSTDKQLKRIGAFLFILSLVLTILAVVAVIGAGIAYTLYIVDEGLTTRERGNLACALDTVDSCSFCSSRNSGVGLVECPEWTTTDVTKVSRTQVKQSMTLAVIFLIYAISALRFGFVLWKHINQYEIEYV